MNPDHASRHLLPSPAYDIDSFEPAVRELAQALTQRGWMLATAESCTGGLISAACTALAGSSAWFERGFVTYSNHAKAELLGVPQGVLNAHGAVSRETAEAMASGALAHSKARLSIAVTGIAGPDGGTPDKPVGTVWVAVASAGGVEPAAVRSTLLQLDGDRAAVRGQTVVRALALALEVVGQGGQQKHKQET